MAVYSIDSTSILQPSTAAPTFSLPAAGHDRVSLRYYCGDTLQKPHLNATRHIIVLSFWATYCKPCKKELPELMKFASRHTTDSIKVFAVSIDKEAAAIVGPYIKENNLTLTVLLDPYKKTAERYGVKSLPALFVIDRRGVIRYSSVGYNENEPLDTKLETIITDICSGRTVSVQQASVNGEAVSVDSTGRQPAGTAVSSGTVPSPQPITAKDRWNAIVAVECGMALDKLADSLAVAPQEIKRWYGDLKNAAIKLWQNESVKK